MAQQPDYYTLVTDTGLAKESNAHVEGNPKVHLSQMAIGDGSGEHYEPASNMTALRQEVYRTSLNTVYTDPKHPNQLIIEAVIPAEVGGFTIREVGIIDSDGDLFAIGNYPETLKPVLSSGAGKDLYIRLVLAFANTPDVQLIIDPTVTLVSVDELVQATKQLEARITHEMSHIRKALKNKVATEMINATHTLKTRLSDIVSHDGFITQPRFTHNQTLATTEFVQHALGSHSRSVAITTADYTITEEDAGSVLAPQNIACTLTLPSITELNQAGAEHQGTTFRIINGCYTSEVRPQLPDLINLGFYYGEGQDVITLGSYESVEISKIEGSLGGNWSVTGGSYHARMSMQQHDFSHAHASYGYQYLLGGFLMQWGEAQVSNGHTVVNLPLTFRKSIIQAFATASSGHTDCCVSVRNITNATIEIWLYNGDDSAVSGNCRYFAIGH